MGSDVINLCNSTKFNKCLNYVIMHATVLLSMCNLDTHCQPAILNTNKRGLLPCVAQWCCSTRD